MRYKNEAFFRQKIERLLMRASKAQSADALLADMKIKKADRPGVLLTLQKMEAEGRISRNKKGKYTLSAAVGRRGRIVSLSKGFAFARMEDGGEDCFIPGRYLRDALPGDVVRIREGAPDERGPQGAVIAIEEEGPRLYVGRLLPKEEGRYCVAPDTAIRFPVRVRKSTLEGVQPGDKIRFSVQWKEEELVASAVTVYGSADSAKVCADAIVDSMGIPTVFPGEVLAAAQKLEQAGISAEELKGREDFRDSLVFSIDGKDAKDLDDAVSLEPSEDGGWVLGVHIADVSHYVQAKSPLDKEALLRGTSVYFADRVIPMLPPALSNGICSLHPATDKLTLSALLYYDGDFRFQKSRLVKSVINSKVRGVYSEINDLFEGTANEEIREKYKPVEQPLRVMRRLAAKLKADGEARGTMDLISTEAQFILDEQGAPAAIFPRITGEAEGMIEQFMIAANVAVAAMARQKKLPFVYRVHENPSPEKLALLMDAVRLLGFKTQLPTSEPAQTVLRALMEEARQTPYARLISERLLRSMAKAKYSENPLGHYGLALQDYCHFTSPIRRYPDLAIHRILTDFLSHTPKAALMERYGSFARTAADASTACEIRAMTAERECESCYKAEYMAGFLGKIFTGVVSSVTEFGIYVELPNTVEGMIRLENLSEDVVRFDGGASVIDRHGRPLYTIGDKIDIQVAACDISTGRISFVPAGPLQTISESRV